MMGDVDPQAIIDEARTWLGTPFHHQQAVKGAGADCVGLIMGASRACGMVYDPALWRPFRNYARVPNPRRMISGLELFFRRVDNSAAQLADVLYMQWREDLPTHLAFVSSFDGRPTMIHAFSDFGKVVEHGFTDPWPGRVHSTWRLPIVRTL
jgi:NlpC/P60 family putative phage cell wall peptidase